MACARTCGAAAGSFVQRTWRLQRRQQMNDRRNSKGSQHHHHHPHALWTAVHQMGEAWNLPRLANCRHHRDVVRRRTQRTLQRVGIPDHSQAKVARLKCKRKKRNDCTMKTDELRWATTGQTRVGVNSSLDGRVTYCAEASKVAPARSLSSTKSSHNMMPKANLGAAAAATTTTVVVDDRRNSVMCVPQGASAVRHAVARAKRCT